ncbi:MAG: acyltransferase [Blautia sp.]|uniref:acyltransferase n=1 Tax=Blautia sp. TaxID=1955243 RepID=UPI002590ED4E|nr:acyltransferase [Blautia sp.]MCI7289264.1 acyltransferase [Blautia sp.]
MEWSKTERRNLGLECLRICSMFMIIFLHSIDHSGLYERIESGTLLYDYEQFMYALVQVGVNCFILISGFFLVKSQFKLRKLISLWIEVVFYAFTIKLFMMATGRIVFSFTALLSCFVPILTGRYWFITIYFGMYFMFPFYTIAIKAMSKQQYKKLIVLLIILFSGLNSIYPSFKGMNSGGAWGLAWFSVLYFIGAYFRIYYQPSKNGRKCVAVFGAIPIIMTSALVIVQKISIEFMSNIVKNWWKYDSVPVLLASMALFAAFINIDNMKLNAKLSQLIIKISKTTLGVYLIHAHANVCTEELWRQVGIPRYMLEWWFPIYQLGVVTVIFAGCSLIDCLRQWIFSLVKIDKIKI